MTSAIAPARSSAPLVGAYVPEIISLAQRALLWAVLYGLVTLASRGGCVTPEPGTEPVCYNATLGPSPITWLLMAVVFVFALTRAAKATRTADITRILRRTATAMWLIPLLVAVLSLAAFLSASPDAWIDGPAPSGVTVVITSD